MMERDWREQCEEFAKSPPVLDIPEERFDLVVPRSRCPSCGNPIKAWQNIPVISYLIAVAPTARNRFRRATPLWK
jgi:leader peptidase (prepilin peptidase)/N-methyltransferase